MAFRTLSLLLCWLLLDMCSLPVTASEVSYSIKEELSPGTIFGYIADDSDLRRKVSPDEIENLRYSFLTQGNPYSQYFAIDPKTGVLSVASRIDRETVCSFRPECLLTINAVVQSELGPFFHIISVQVEVTDVNDNPPTFSQQIFKITIAENSAMGVSYPLPIAFDRDTGTNNTVRDYFLLSNKETFSLRTTEDDMGTVQTALQVNRELNREETAAITVLVGARDAGRPPLTGTLTVQVTVADVNDNYPVFDPYVYYVNVTETTRTDVPLVQVKAKDDDVGANGNVTYSFSQQQPQDVLNLFRMEVLSGTMYLSRSVENHTGKIYELVVEASDQGSPPKISRALVRVRVLDTVNSRPEIFVDILASGSAQAEVSEYAEVGKVVAHVSVRDPDSGENGVTTCRLSTKDFELQPLNNLGQYKVILVTNLDREKTQRYDITVGCNDFGFPPLENSAKFVVIIRDENDNPPVFSERNYHTTINENGVVGAVVAQLTVTDLDIGRNAEVTYRVAGPYSSDFEIMDNGTMIATAPLDREVSEKLVVKVLAVDKGFPPQSGSATVYITLEDVNDLAPSFNEKRYSFSVSEDARPGSYVGIVAADDGDLGRNAEIIFLAEPDEDGFDSTAFIITKEGTVKTNKELDRETQDVYFFTVIARDGGDPPLSTTATVTIHVDDVNDNTPQFLYPTQSNDTLSIPHTFPLRTPVTRVLALDGDAGKNAQLVYSCASANDSGLFGMNSETGDLFLHRYLSRGQVGMYVLRVAAHDEGTPQLSNQTILYVDIYFDNSTLFDLAQAATPSKVLMTTLILVGVVLLVGGVAITALICIKRSETKKKKTDVTSENQAPSNKIQGGYYIAPGVCESPAFGGGSLGKPIPEQAGASRDNGSACDTNSLRITNPYVIMPPHSNFSDAEGPPEIIEIPRNGLYHRSEDPYPDDIDRGDDSRFSTFRSQDGALSNFRQNSLRRQSADTLDEPAKRADDTLSLSELSYQSTSDSGRGGSEFDVNNAGNRDKGASVQNAPSPLLYKGNNSLRAHDPDVTFATFRGESPCSFRFDSDSDTLTRNPRNGSARASPLPLSYTHHLQPHARSFQSITGNSTPSAQRLAPGQQTDSSRADEAASLGRRNGTGRRAVTPNAETLHYGPGAGSEYGAPQINTFAGGISNGQFGPGPGRNGFGPSFEPSAPSNPVFVFGARNNGAPPTEFRGRNNLGNVALPRRGGSDYVNAYSDHESGDDTRMGADYEAHEADCFLPPYPDVLEEREEEEEDEEHGQISERSALNSVPGISTWNRGGNNSLYRLRQQSEV